MILLGGCNNYLEVKPDPLLVTPNSLESLQALLDNPIKMNLSTNSFAQGSSDEYYLEDQTFNSFSQTDRSIYVWDNYDYQWDNDWAQGYVIVFTCNLILEQLESIPRTSENASMWDNIKGSALFFRAHSYLTMLWSYALAYDEQVSDHELGIVIRKFSNPHDPSIRSSVTECYQQVITDLEHAVKFLPRTQEHVMRPSQAAGYGMLARTYLSMRKYEEALKYAEYSLGLLDLGNVLDYNDPEMINIDSGTPFRRFNRETVFYSEIRLLTYTVVPQFSFVDSTLYKSYDHFDLRKRAFFNNNTGKALFKGTYATGMYLFSGITIPELILMQVECLSRLGSAEKARNILIEFLQNRYETGTQLIFSQDNREFLDQVLLERRKELVMRGLRWMDVKRLNKENRDILLSRKINGEIYVLPPNDLRYALPLPQDIITISGMKQNPR